MKKFGFLAVLIIAIYTFASTGCTKRPKDGGPLYIDSSLSTGSTGTTGTTGSVRKEGDLKVYVIQGTSIGPAATGATVSLALTRDSLDNSQFFISGQTDNSGYAQFDNLDPHNYFIHADYPDPMSQGHMVGDTTGIVSSNSLRNVTLVVKL
jgi:hypothetical protein